MHAFVYCKFNMTCSQLQDCTQFSSFQPISTVDVVTAVRRLPVKSSAVDPLPVNLLKQVVDELAELFNRSLALGHFPHMYKDAYVTPLLKKPSLDVADVKSYRPISNLSVLSKLLERLVIKQLIDYLKSAKLFPLYLSNEPFDGDRCSACSI